MKTKNSKNRAVGAIIGALIGDALGVGPHWYNAGADGPHLRLIQQRLH